MMSYWANFAHTGNPGRGRDNSLESWQPWDTSSPDAPKFIIFDTEAGGGLRMSSEFVTNEQLVARLATDERFESERDRCEVFFQYAGWRQTVSDGDYAKACPDYPMDDYPWDD
jgi:para-nitrobenzyl esterase